MKSRRKTTVLGATILLGGVHRLHALAAKKAAISVGLLLLAWQLLMGSAWARSYTFINVADSTEEFSGLFSPPQLNAGGTLLFSAELDTGVRGWFTKVVGGPTTTIASNATGFDGFGGGFGSINASGTVAFQGLPSGSLSEGIYTGAGGAPTLIAGSDAASPFSGFGSSGVEAINDAGTVAFYATRRASAGGGEGIFTGDGTGPITTVADSTSGFIFVSPQPAINAGGSVAFSGFTSAVAGIFVVAPGGAVTTIADTSDGLTSLVTTSINNSGTVVFSASGETVSSIFTGNGGALTTVADTAGDYRGWGFPSINNDGMVVFGAMLEDFRNGIFTGPDPVADKVIIAGDTLFGATVLHVEFFRGLNDNGDIAFKYDLDNGVTGVALAIVPEPSGLGLLAAAGIGCLLRRRRHD